MYYARQSVGRLFGWTVSSGLCIVANSRLTFFRSGPGGGGGRVRARHVQLFTPHYVVRSSEAISHLNEKDCNVRPPRCPSVLPSDPHSLKHEERPFEAAVCHGWMQKNVMAYLLSNWSFYFRWDHNYFWRPGLFLNFSHFEGEIILHWIWSQFFSFIWSTVVCFHREEVLSKDFN